MGGFQSRFIWEEEYEAAVADFLDGRLPDAYGDYLRGIDAHETNEGYFSIDKKGNQVESKKEKKAESEREGERTEEEDGF